MPAFSAGLTLRLFDVARSSSALEAAEARFGLLSCDERPAGSATGKDPLSHLRRLSRTALRLSLAAAGVQQAFGQPLARAPGGKPFLPGQPVSFSLSHVETHVLVALSDRGPVGIDLEATRPLLMNTMRRGRIIAAASGLGMPGLGADTEPADDGAALQAWTGLEAWGKAEGTGVGRLLADLGIFGPQSSGESRDQVVAAARERRDRHGFALAPLDLGVGLYGAVCTSAALLTSPGLRLSPLDDSGLSELAAAAAAVLPVDRAPRSGQ